MLLTSLMLWLAASENMSPMSTIPVWVTSWVSQLEQASSLADSLTADGVCVLFAILAL